MVEAPTVVKCLVWDLDNTLWQGTLAEDPEVRLSSQIRELVAALDSRGILQSVVSKNDHDHAWGQLEALGIAEYFVLPKIGWGPKSASVLEIAEQLNFAQHTIAFIDDLPAERAEVAFHAPQVRCYPAEAALTLAELPEFSPTTVTEDSRRRREAYQAAFRRDTAKREFSGPDEAFLRSLELVMTVRRADEEDLSRVEELTLRTSQMNATGIHYSDATLRGLLADPGHEVLTASLTDRFGPHGAIGVMLLGYRPSVWHLRLLATSCRVISFGAGTVLLNWLVDETARAGRHLVADFRPTDRNRMMEIACRFAGFTDDDCPCRVDLGPDDGPEGLRRLHMVPQPREASSTVRLHAPDLAGAGA